MGRWLDRVQKAEAPRTADDLAADLLALAEHWAQCEADRTAAEAIRDALRTVLGEGWTCTIPSHHGACEAHRMKAVRAGE